ncbi:MAG: glucose-6-phosphate dehydrogenase [Phycisphaerae bacterium]
MNDTPPCILVIFGASGDLARLKLLPAIYELAREKLLPEKFALVGYSRTKMSDDDFRDRFREAVEEGARTKGQGIDEGLLESLVANTSYHPGQYDAAEDFKSLDAHLRKLDDDLGTAGNRLFYLSVPPNAFEPVLDNLGGRSMVRRGAAGSRNGNDGPWQRVVIEKPFGFDLASARELNGQLLANFAEEQVFRIDHYLGKETVQNLMVMRFANSIFEPLFNHKYVEHVQITVAEDNFADDRAGYYDKSGATRDMVQNHIFQLMSLIAMEPPVALDARSIRDEKVKVYRSIRPIRPERIKNQTVRGQYTAGELHGKTTPGYLGVEDVPDDSRTETFSALKLYIDNWRWDGTPFYVRTGKALPQKLTEVVVRFASPPDTLFSKMCQSPLYPNDLVINVSPSEGISLRLNGKVPGGGMNVKQVALDFLYEETFKKQPPEAYERLIYDAMLGDQALFIRGDEAEAAWGVITPILEAWAEQDLKPEPYAPGTWGPKGAFSLIENDGRRWMHADGEEPEPIVACSIR